MSIRHDILDLINRNPSISAGEIAEQLSGDPQKIKRNIQDCKKAGLVTAQLDDVTGQPGYTITESGRAKLAEAPRKSAGKEVAKAIAPLVNAFPTKSEAKRLEAQGAPMAKPPKPVAPDASVSTPASGADSTIAQSALAHMDGAAEHEEEMPPADPVLLASANRMLSERLEGVAHALRGCGLEALRNVTGSEDLQPHVAALSGAFQQSLGDVEFLRAQVEAQRMQIGKWKTAIGCDTPYVAQEQLGMLRTQKAALLEQLEKVAAERDALDMRIVEMTGLRDSAWSEIEGLRVQLANQVALTDKLEHLLQSARNELEHLRAHSQAAGDADQVNHPPHYTAGSIECIDAIRAALTDDEYRGYVKGNALKYIWRERHKGGQESLAKAVWYLGRIAA